MAYSHSNVFARIIKKEIPCRTVAETPYSLAFYDAHPNAPVHVLVIPKGPYESASVFFSQAPSHEILDFCTLMGQIPEQLGLKKEGYRLISNEGAHAGQEVPHFHIHILGGKELGPLIGL
jgi:histidine triad (HIT) family protein